MIRYIKYFTVLTLLIVIAGCKKKEYTMGNLTAPSNVVINTTIVGQDATHPNQEISSG